MAKRNLRGAKGIVTGASSGIGRAIARELAKQGARIVVTARRAERLESLKEEVLGHGGELLAFPGDVADANHRQRLLEFAESALGGVDFLVNNAGIGGTGEFTDSTTERMRQIMEVNFFAPVELVRIALPLLRKGTKPIIVNVSSVLGHRAVRRKSEYCASKFALHGFSDSLRAELASQNIDVLLVSPSTTDTEFFEKYGGGKPSFGRRWLKPMSSEAVAIRTVRAMQQGRSEIILSLGGKFLVWLDRLVPPLANRIISRWS